MQTTIQSFSDLKTSEYGPSARVKLGNGDQVYVNEDPTNLVGKTVDINVNEKTSQKTGKTYKVGKITKVYETTAASSNGNSNGAPDKITWDDYRALVEQVHSLAMKLEPDGINVIGENDPTTIVDRSPARVGFVNNVMRAYAEGRFIVPKDDEDDIPPF